MRIFRNVSAFLVSLSVAILCCYCAPGPLKRQLSDIESFIDSRPDSALAAIRQIDVAALRGGATKAKYALLHAAALDKNYIDTADTRIVQPAVDYYDRHGSPNQRLLAHYLLGCVYRDLRSAPRALEEYQRAASQADTTRADCDLPTLMRVHAQMAEIYTFLRLYEYAEKEALIAERVSWDTKDTLSALLFSMQEKKNS